MRNEPLDFIGVDYAIDNRDVEESILPLAQERKIGVLVYVPFGRTRLFKRVGVDILRQLGQGLADNVDHLLGALGHKLL